MAAKAILGALFALSVLAPAPLALAANPDEAVGTWVVAKGDAKIAIYKCDTKLCGQVVWLKNPADDVDEKNPDPARRKDKIVGKVILWNFQFDGDEWVKGRIYDPESGDTYRCKMWMDGGKLEVKGYVGVSLFGRAETWTRAS